MSLVLDTRRRAISSSGAILVGATLTIYDAGTTNLSSIYRDAALGTPMTNPTSGSDVSDSGGWFPQIFAAEGGLYDITLKTSAGVTVKSEVSVPALGSSTAAITRDFGTGGRLRINGSSDEIRVEGGDPTGDDSGGKITLGGYLGTQADVVKLDGASVNTTGTFTENSKNLTGVVSDAASFTGVTSVVVPLTNSPAGIRMWDIDLIDLNSSAGVALKATLSFDNNVTYAATLYDWMYELQDTSAVGVNSGSAGTAMQLGASLPVGNYLATMRVVTTGSSGRTFLTGTLLPNDVSNRAVFSASHTASAARATHIKFLVSSGTMSGSYRVLPQRGF